ncbi:hypothetical protein SAMN04488034_10918 [Salinimicrobium catena]|uniref:Uncharacterized protein n=1 Tax=Salinimicrobium catena TaxID=390640 RepID=A0A1H5P4R4_9FLAO|nr:hypothetical protein [Salinimicrobium catena]SDL72161.1 hypothetical protein SAMN04488140_10964 [Salinimicrobium catena]SEF08982.1 hypothetical protein SAMN04488034_10918 [Salinimicrobium catena]
MSNIILMIFPQFIIDFDQSILLPTILSSTVLIALFVIGRFLDSLVERKRNTQEWYMKMVLEPHTKLIHEYFQNSIDQTKNFGDELTKNSSIENKMLLFEVFANDKRRVEFNFILLVSKPYPDTANNLTKFVNDLHDKCISFLDEGDYSLRKFEKLEKDLMSLKGDFFQEIYHPFRIKSTWKWIKNNYLLTLVVILFMFFMYIIGSNLKTKADQKDLPTSNSPISTEQFRQG